MKTNSKNILHFIPLCLAAGALLLTACNAPTASGLVGATPKTLDAKDWNGRWHSADDAFHVRVVEAEPGVLELANVEEKDQRFSLSLTRLLVREEGDALLFNLVNDDDARHPYVFGRMVQNSNVMVAWPCRSDAIEQLINQRVIAGEVTVENKTRHVHVTGGFDALAKRLAAPDGWLLLQLDAPFTMLRDRAAR